MVKIAGLTVSIIDIDKILLSWYTSGVSESNTIVVQRSNSPEGPFEDIVSLLDDSSSYTDNIYPESKHRQYYYQIVLGSQKLGPLRFDFKTDRISQGIIWQESRALQRHLGTACKLFVRKTSGEKCTTCYDDILERAEDGDCHECLGTRFVDGYFKPIDILLAFPQSQLILTNNGLGEDMPVRLPGVWTSNYPIISPGDVVIRIDDKTAWRVDSPVTRTAKKLYIIRQSLNLTQLSPSEVEYDLLGRMYE